MSDEKQLGNFVAETSRGRFLRWVLQSNIGWLIGIVMGCGFLLLMSNEKNNYSLQCVLWFVLLFFLWFGLGGLSLLAALLFSIKVYDNGLVVESLGRKRVVRFENIESLQMRTSRLYGHNVNVIQKDTQWKMPNILVGDRQLSTSLYEKISSKINEIALAHLQRGYSLDYNGIEVYNDSLKWGNFEVNFSDIENTQGIPSRDIFTLLVGKKDGITQRCIVPLSTPNVILLPDLIVRLKGTSNE